MSNFYIKVPPHIAKKMGITDKRTLKLPDGNFMAYITHFKPYCPIYQIREMVPQMGCLILTPGQMKEEREGKVNRPLPEPTDPTFAAPQPEPIQEVEEPMVEETPQQEETPQPEVEDAPILEQPSEEEAPEEETTEEELPIQEEETEAQTEEGGE